MNTEEASVSDPKDFKAETASVVMRFPITIGEPSLLSCRQGPDLYFRGTALKSNIKQPCFAYTSSFKAGNVDCLHGGQVDIFSFGKEGMPLDVPTLSPGNSFVFEGDYTGLIPEGTKKGDAFTLEITVDGFGSIVDEHWSETPEPKRGARYNERRAKLEPNYDSELKIEEYAFGMEFEIILGKKCRLEGRVSPDTCFRISSVIANVPCPSFARVSEIMVANVVGVGCGGPTGSHVLSLIERPLRGQEDLTKAPPPAHVEGLPTVTAKSGAIDLWNLRHGKGIIDLPTLTPANTVGLFGYYDGKVPEGYEHGEIFRLSVMFAGCASIVA
jgi:hypothetical protein